MKILLSVFYFSIIFMVPTSFAFTQTKTAKITAVVGDKIQVDIGKEDGVKINITGKVYNFITVNTKKTRMNLAIIKVVEVRDYSCICEITQKAEGKEIVPGLLVDFTLTEKAAPEDIFKISSKANEYYNANNLTKALELYNKILKMQPDNREAKRMIEKINSLRSSEGMNQQKSKADSITASEGIGTGTGGVQIESDVKVENIQDDAPPADYVAVEKSPEIVKMVRPVYPEIARKAGMEGTVWVKLWVTKEGKIKEVQIVKSDSEIFNQAAMDASKQFVFTPAISAAGPVAVWVMFPFKFSLKNTPSKEEQITITGWEQYQDQYTNLSFTHPQGWFKAQDGRSVMYFSSQDVIDRFVDLTSKGKDGAKLLVTTQKLDSIVSLETYMNRLKEDLTIAGFEVSVLYPITMGNLPALMILFNGYVTIEAKLNVAQVCALRDSFLYTIKLEAFNDAFNATNQAFDVAVASIILPEKNVAIANVDPSIPEKEFKNVENKYLKVSIPANFDATTPAPKAPMEFSVEIKGYRQDCYLRIDVVPAQKLTSEKVVEQNSRFYKSTSKGETTIDGVKTVYLNYSPMKGIQSRVYFIVKNDKIYRIIMNYYEPMKNTYLQPFEKIIGSISVK